MDDKATRTSLGAAPQTIDAAFGDLPGAEGGAAELPPAVPVPSPAPSRVARQGLKALLAASVALPPLALVQGDAAWAQLGSSSNVPPQNVFGGGTPNVTSEPKRPQADAESQGEALRPDAARAGGGANVPPAPPATGRGENSADAVRILIDQASYWQSQYQTDKALDALRRALLADPRNPDALALQAQIQAERGDQQAAQASLSRLRQVRPDDPRIAGIEQGVRSGPVDQGGLSEARRSAQQGRYAEAVQRYQRVFRGEAPPAGLAVEYYQTLGGSEGGFDQAREGLGRIVINNPQDLRAQFAYAQLLTFRETTREEGIRRLNTLSQSPVVGEQARQALRQALIWLPNDPSSVPQLNVYVQRNPGDQELRQKLETAQNPPRAPLDAAGQARVNGFDQLKRGRVAEAERSFNEALAANPQDADALGGLGVLRLRQGRTAEARTLLQRAVQIDPEWQAALRGANQVGRGGTGGGGGTAGNAGQYREVARLANEGSYGEAEARLRRLMGNRPNTGGLLQLGDIQARAGRLGEAEQTFRQVLGREPRNGPAAVGLAGVLIRQNREDEAQRLYAQVGGGEVGRAIGRARAERLRQQARGIDDPVAQAGLFRQAAEADPSNPWLRLELARALERQGRGPEAQRVMDDVAARAAPGSEGVQAAIIYAAQVDDLDRAGQLVGRLPPGARTPELRAIQERVAVRNEIRTSAYSGSRRAVREQLVRLAAQPDPTGARGSEIAKTLARQGDPVGARNAVVAGLQATRAPTAAQRAAYAGALLEAGQTADAEAVAESVDRRALPTNQREFFAGVENGIAIRRTERLREEGKVADAYDVLAPRLRNNPASPDLNMALGRLYQSDGDPKQAIAINEELLRRNPNNPDVRRALVGALVQAGEYSRADEVVAEIKEQAPSDPRAYMLSAEVARARGFNGRALADLRQARELRLQQLGGTRQAAPAAVRGAPPPAPDNPFRRGRQESRLGPEVLPVTRVAAAPVEAPAAVTPVASASPPTGGIADPAMFAAVDAVRDAPRRVQAAEADVRPADAAALDWVPAAESPRAPLVQLAAAPVRLVPNAAYKAELAQGVLSGETAPLSNPFRRGTVGTGDTEPFVPGVLGETAAPGAPGLSRPPSLPADPLIASLDRDIDALQQETAPTVQLGLGFRGRSGDVGLSQLFEVQAPLEAQFSPGGVGRLKLLVTPTYLTTGGGIDRGTGNPLLWGTNPLSGATAATAPIPGNPEAFGVAVNLAYSYQWATVDVGSTPIGFRRQNVVGGVELAPQIVQDVRLRLIGERRAVTDSLLSYAGQRDLRTGQEWGGVVRNRGRAQIEWTPGDWVLYAGGGGGVVTGHNVADNGFYEVGAGASYPIYKTPSRELRLGLNLLYTNYNKNLDFFTFGHGGYFSPQDYFAALIPLTWREKVNDRFEYQLGASIGVQTFTLKSTSVFPNNPDLQASLEQRIAAGTSPAGTTLVSRFARQSDTSPAGGVSAQAEYKLTNNIRVGGRAAFQRAGNFNEGTALIYARYTFTGAI